MKWKSIGLVLVLVGSGAIIYYKANHARYDPAALEEQAALRVLLVADLREADSEADACAEIIRMVRAAKDRGFRVQEFQPHSKSEILRRHRILTVPTVVIFDQSGRTTARFEGEDRETIAKLRAALRALQ